MNAGSLVWSAERATWPNAEASRFVEAGGLRWHVQQMGEGPVLLLIHGTAASTHSWRSLAPLLSRQFTVIAPDLPGHGFTSSPRRRDLSLPAMARAVGALVDELGVRPAIVVGHSAGAAIAIRCCLDGGLSATGVVGINAALMPFRGAAGFLFPPLAKLLFLNPLTPRVVARSAADRDRVERLIRDTGSKLDATGIDLYARLFRSSTQVAAALGMMANWDLHRFARALPELDAPLLLIVGERDDAVKPAEADRAARRLPSAAVERLPGLGHLAHEEDAAAVAAPVVAFADSVLRSS